MAGVHLNPIPGLSEIKIGIMTGKMNWIFNNSVYFL